MSNDRLEAAWKLTKDWIAERDGSAREFFLMDVPLDRARDSLERLRRRSRKFTLQPLWREARREAPRAPPSALSLAAALERLQAGTLASLTVRFTPPELDLPLAITVGKAGAGKVDLDAVWWPHQAFSGEVEPSARFQAILQYFVTFQAALGSPKLYLNSECSSTPREPGSGWIEV